MIKITEETFAAKIKAARTAKNLTQQALSDLTGIPRRTIQDWEAGKMEPAAWNKELILEKILTIKTPGE